MQISKRKVNSALEKQVARMWYQLIADIKTPEEAEKIFGDLFSNTELSVITKRLAVGYWLLKKRSYDNIRENLKVSSATIASVHHQLGGEGWKKAFFRVTADEWANVWEQKIKKFLKKK